MEMRYERKMKMNGRDGLVNAMYVSCTPSAKKNVVFFPGDIQNFLEEMHGTPCETYMEYSYEHTAEILLKKFGFDANIWIIQPAEFRYHAFSRYTNFVPAERQNVHGAILAYSRYGQATDHLISLLANAFNFMKKECWVNEDLLIDLMGFSKGVLVLNEIITELGTFSNLCNVCEERLYQSATRVTITAASEKCDHQFIMSTAARFFRKVRTIYWLDGGNGSLHSVFPNDKHSLEMLLIFRKLSICVYQTPYQYASKERPWIDLETRAFVALVQDIIQDRYGVTTPMPIHYQHYFDQEYPGTIDQHFKLLTRFDTIVTLDDHPVDARP